MTTLIVSRSPQNPDDIVFEARTATPEHVRRASEQARAAGRHWSAVSAATRAETLYAAAESVAAHATDLAELVVREVGKPVTEARGEVARMVAILRYYAQAALDPHGTTIPAADGRSLLYTRHHPRGVVGLITPWNFPLAIPTWKAAPALAYGNAVLLKPSPDAVGCASRLAEILRDHLPDGLFHVLPGTADTGEAVVSTVDALSFTGSVAVGRQVAVRAATRGIAVQCELGGQNPSIVLPDADIARAASAIAGAAMSYAGQKCTATSRVIVVGSPAPFTEALVEAIDRLPVGDPANPAVQVGPLISQPARDRVHRASAEAVARGARRLTGGEHHGSGWYHRPELLDQLNPHDRAAQDEVFGPFAVLLHARDVNDAVHIANDVRYGLAAAVFTRDVDRALDVADRLEAGMIRVNAPTTGVDLHAPFGGTKDSSIGPREQGKAARDFYTITRTTMMSPEGS